MDPVIARHHGLLGTTIELQIWAESPSSAGLVEMAAINEIERLQGIFNVHDAGSGIRRWLTGQAAPPELDEVLALAVRWRELSRGAFDPAVGALVELWDAAAAAGHPPTDEERRAVLAAMRDPADPRSRPSNLNAIAKGWIVDCSLRRACEVDGAVGLTINAGGDLLHRGPRALIVGIEDPQRPYDNEPPLVRVRLPHGALATSGGARRGWAIAGRWYSHVIDPRSGQSVDHVASASVIAPDAATADAVATVLSVSSVPDGLAFVARLEDVCCCLITRDGELHRDGGWLAAQVTP